MTEAVEAPAATAGDVWTMTTAEARREIGKLRGYRVRLLDDSELFALYLPAAEAPGGERLWGPFGNEECAWGCKYLPNWPGAIAAAWPLFEEMQAALNTAGESMWPVVRALEALIPLKSHEEDGPHVRFSRALRRLSPHFICAWWLSWRLERMAIISEETEAKTS